MEVSVFSLRRGHHLTFAQVGDRRPRERAFLGQVDHHTLPILHRLELVLHVPEERLQRAELHVTHAVLQWALQQPVQYGVLLRYAFA